jgi:hypothetical protein
LSNAGVIKMLKSYKGQSYRGGDDTIAYNTTTTRHIPDKECTEHSTTVIAIFTLGHSPSPILLYLDVSTSGYFSSPVEKTRPPSISSIVSLKMSNPRARQRHAMTARYSSLAQESWLSLANKHITIGGRRSTYPRGCYVVPGVGGVRRSKIPLTKPFLDAKTQLLSSR